METPFLRVATPADAEAIAAIYAPYVQRTTISFETEAPNAEEMGRRIGDILPRYPWIVCETGGEVVGYAYAHAYGERAAYSWSAVSSVYIAETARGKGLGRTLYAALEALLTAQGIHSLYAHVTHPNPASEAFHLALGYEQQALFPKIGYKFGEWIAVVHYCKVLLPHGKAPAAPIPFGALDAGIIRDILSASAE